MWLFFTSFIYIYKLCCFIFFSELLCWKNYTLTRTRIERRHAKFNDNLRDHDLPTASRILYTYGGLNKLFNIIRSSMFVYNIDKGRRTCSKINYNAYDPKNAFFWKKCDIFDIFNLIPKKIQGHMHEL